MKKIDKFITLSFLFLSMNHYVNAQQIRISTYTEVTVVSPKVGTFVGIVFPGYIGNIEIGGFYQQSSSLGFGTQEQERRGVFERNFKGLYTAFSMYHVKKLDVNLNVRVGTMNNESFSIIPTVQGDYQVSRYMSIGVGGGLRNFMPSFMAKVSILMSR